MAKLKRRTRTILADAKRLKTHHHKMEKAGVYKAAHERKARAKFIKSTPKHLRKGLYGL